MKKNAKEQIMNAIDLWTEEEDTRSSRKILRDMVQMEFAQFGDYIGSEARTADEIREAMQPVKAAIGVYNDFCRLERLEELEAMPYKEAMASYLATQCVAGLAIRKDEDGYTLADDPAVTLDPVDFYTVKFASSLPAIYDLCAVYADNLARFDTKDDTHIARRSMTPGYIAFRDRCGWNVPADQLSKGKLAQQLTQLCEALAPGFAPRMISADVRYLLHAIITAKPARGDKAGELQVRNEQTVLRFVFRALYTRINGLAYSDQIKTRAADKAPRTYKENEAAGESSLLPEFRPLPIAEGGEVVCEAC